MRHSEPLRVGQTVSHYRILELIGEGGMGVVFRAEDLRLHRPVALKFLPPHLVADERAKNRFRQEAQAASALDHPHVCVIHEIDETPSGELFIAMAHCGGESLRQLLERGPLPVATALDIARQVAQGLAKAHERGVIHRDIKPDNVKATEDGIWKVLDFGIARLVGASRLTRTGATVGTVAYMAPEQASDADPSPQSDIWSLGVMLYEMLTGRLPFHGTSTVATLYQVLHEEPAPVRSLRDEVPAELERIVVRALAKDLHIRYARMTDLLEDLAAVDALGPAMASDGRAPVGDGARPRVTTRPPFLTPSRASSGETLLSPFVGRAPELEVLEDWIREAAGGRGRVGFVTGEAGTGKTSLAREGWRRAMDRDPDLVVAVGRCTAHTGVGDPYHPFREILSQLTGDVEAQWAGGSLSADHATRLWSLTPLTVDALVKAGEDLVGTFVSQSAIAARAEEHPAVRESRSAGLHRLLSRETTSQTIQQADLFEQFVRVLRSLARERPLLLVLDDLQWADTGSIGLLFHLGRQLSGTRILVLGLYRPSELALGRGGERHPLEPVLNELKGLFGNIEVGLDRTEGRAFTDALIDTEPNRLGDGFREALFQQTQGHALFTVELLRDLKERGALVRDEGHGWMEAPGLDWASLPARIDAVLGERIGRLSAELQHLLTVAAVEGERFTLEAVADVVGQPVPRLVALVSRELEKRHRLVTAEGVHQVDGRRLSTYRFRHILFQRHLYDGLDAVERSELHQEVGEALERLYGEKGGEIAVRLAQHFREAGADGKAAEYLQMAGAWAKRTGAATEAITHFRGGLDVLRRTPASPGRDRREMALCLALGSCIQESGDFASAEAGGAFDRAAELAHRLNDSLSLQAAQSGRYLLHHMRSSLETARNIAEERLRIAEELGDPVWLHWGRDSVARNMLARGDLSGSFRLYERALLDVRLAPGDAATAAAMGWGWEIEATFLSTMALARWLLGYPDQALDLSTRGSTLARSLADPATPALAFLYQSWARIWRREVDYATAAVKEFRALVERRGLSGYQSYVLMLDGWCVSRSGREDEGINLLREGLRKYDASGQTLWRSLHCALLVDPLLQSGRLDEAEALLREALAAEEATGDVANRAETLRLKGELLRARGEPRLGEAEAAFRQAIEVAWGQEAKSYELRATVGLARLLHSQGRTAEACETLAAIYGWFTEGFDTGDLIEARDLLAQLEQACSPAPPPNGPGHDTRPAEA